MPSVDKRVVEMQFDNKQFESGVQTSINTLDKLKESLNLDGVGKGLEELNATASSFDLSSMENSLNSLSERFSTMGIIGMTAIQNLTSAAMEFGSRMINKVIEPIKQGGINRALNLEQANFQLRNIIGSAEEAAEIINGPVNDAVTGTAFGLDEAAVVASQMVTAGMRDSDELAARLGTIADVAGMAGSSYSEMGRIFMKVLSKGKAQGEEMAMLTERGIAAFDVIADYLGITTEEVHDAVSAGLIDFEIFADAMDAAFGGSAQKANETFTGALSNMKSALGRIGAKIATPGLEDLRDIFNALRVDINGVNAALDPFIEYINYGLREATDFIVDKLAMDEQEFKDLEDIFVNAVEVIDNVLTGLSTIIAPIGEAFAMMFPPVSLDAIADFTYRLGVVTRDLGVSKKAANTIRTVFIGLFGAIKIGANVFRNLGRIVLSIVGFFGRLLGVLVGTIDGAGDTEKAFEGVNAVMEKTNKIGDAVVGFFDNAASHIQPVVDGLKEFWNQLKSMPAVQRIASKVASVFEKIRKVSVDAINTAIKYIGKLTGTDMSLPDLNAETIARIINDALQKAIDIFEKAKGKAEEFVNFIKDKSPVSFEDLGKSAEGAKSKIEEFFGKFTGNGLDGLKSFFASFKDGLPSMQEVMGVLDDAKTKFGGLLDSLSKILTGGIGDGKTLFKKTYDAMSGFVSGILTAIQDGDWSMLFDAAKVGALAYVLVTLVKILNSTETAISDFSKVPGLITKILEGVVGVLSSYQTKLKADSLFTIAKAVGILAVSLIALAQVPEDDLTNATSAIMGLMIVLGIVMKVVSDFNSSGADAAVKDTLESVKDGVVSFLKGLAAGFAKAAALVGKAALLVSLAIAIAMFVRILSAVANIDWKSFASNMTKAATIAAGLIGIAYALNKFASDLDGGTAASIIAISGAIWILANALKALTNLKWPELFNAGTVIAGLALVLVAVAKSSDELDSEKLLKFSGAMLALSGSLAIMSVALIAISRFMDSKMIITIGLLTAMMIGLGAALKLASAGGWGTEGAKALLVASVGIIAIAGALELLSNNSLTGTIQGIVAIIAVFGAFIAAATLMTGSIPAIMGMASALVTFGAGCALIGVAIAALGAGLYLAAEAINSLKDTLVPFVKAFIDAIGLIVAHAPEIAAVVLTVIAAVLVALNASKIQFAATVVAIVGVVLLALSQCTPELLNTLGTILLQIIDYLGQITEILAQAILQLIYKLINAVAVAIYDNAEPLYAAIKNLLNSLTYLLALGIVEIVENIAHILHLDGIPTISNAIEEMKSALKENFKPEDMSKYTSDIMDAGTEAIKNKSGEMSGATSEAAVAAYKGFENEFYKIDPLTGEVMGGVDQKILGSLPSLMSSSEEAAKGINDSFKLDLDDQTKDEVMQIKNTMAHSSSDLEEAGASATESTADGAKNATGLMADAAGINIEAFTDKFINNDGKAEGAGDSFTKDLLGAFEGSTDMFGEAGTSNIESYISALGDGADDAQTAATDVGNSGVSGLDDASSQTPAVADNFAWGFINRLGEYSQQFYDSGYSAGDTASQGLEDSMEVASPSRRTARTAKFAALGFLLTLSAYSHSMRVAGENIGKETLDGLNKSVSKIAEAVDTDMEYHPVIAPVVDLDGIQKGARLANGMFEDQTIGVAGIYSDNLNLGRGIANIDAIATSGSMRMSDEEVVSAIGELRSDFTQMADAIKHMKIVLDSGRTIGELAPQMDARLGRLAVYKGRGM